MTTAHTAAKLRIAVARLADMIDAADPMTDRTVHTSNGPRTEQRREFGRDAAFLRTVAAGGRTIHSLRKWARSHRDTGSHFRRLRDLTPEIGDAVRFLSSAYEIVACVEINSFEFHRGGEYAGDNTYLTAAAQKCPIVESDHLGGRVERYALLQATGENRFWNRIGAHGNMRVTEVSGRYFVTEGQARHHATDVAARHIPATARDYLQGQLALTGACYLDRASHRDGLGGLFGGVSDESKAIADAWAA